MNERSEQHEAFLDDLALVIDGDPEALQRHADFLVDDDDARDLRHEAAAVAQELSFAGADYAVPADFEARLLAAIDAGATDDAEHPAAEGEAPRSGPGTSPGFRVPSELMAQAAEVAGLNAAPTPPAETPATDAPRAETPATDAPRAETPRAETPRAETPAQTPRAETPRAQTQRAQTPRRKGLLLLLPVVGVVGIAAAAAAAVGLYLWSDADPSGPPPPTLATTGLGGSLGTIDRAADDGQSGVTIRRPGQDAFVALGGGEAVPAGSTLRTDDRTRAQVALDDGSELVLNHATELELVGDSPRSFRLSEGDLVAEVAHLEGAPNASFVTPTGRVEVLGTRFSLSATEDVTSVRVSRGVVSVEGRDGTAAQVRAGEEGLVAAGQAPSVTPVPDLAHSLAWSELSSVDDAEEVDTIAGIGSLRARRPGARDDSDEPLTLASHQVRVRIVGNVARTEIEEVFRNDSDQTLEGVYRFPLPADAQIARLALDVDGRMEEGSFVERDRAARIWRGVIRNATPRAQRQNDEEFIWVPGPWVDPAILEWQRGGQFELRIFPIPAHGERRVILGYTQTVQPDGAQRRYVYPLAHSADDSTRVERFDVDVRVAGAERVSAGGYRVTSAADADATRLTMSEESFSPKGDLTIDYQLPGGEREVRWWTYRGEAAAPPPDDSRERDREVQHAQRALADDDRPYVAFALRPELPRASVRRARDYVIVVDASQSMVGERWHRGARLATHVVGEMDRRDRFTVLACDYRCQQLPGGLRAPGAAASEEVEGWLAAIEPAGASDLVASLREAAATVSADRADDRELHLMYVGDGVSTAGYRRAASLAAETRQLAASERVAISTVGIGGDADTMALRAIARSAGGHYVPYVPGQRISVAALAILETTYGASLEAPRVELPDGLSDVAPAELPTVRAGQELIVVARMDRDHVAGPVTLRGQVAGRPFERTYQVDLTPTESAGNLFVPRLWAAGQIERLQLDGRGEHRAEIIAASKAFGVLSRHTSLLVLESEAMFRAFRVDRNVAPVAQWTGEEDVIGGESGEAVGELAAGGLGLSGFGRGGGGVATGAVGGHLSEEAGLEDDADMANAERRRRGRATRGAPAPAPRSSAAQAPILADREQEAAPRAEAAPPFEPPVARRPGRWMRRVRVRTGEISRFDAPSSRDQRLVEEAEARLRDNPDSRDRHRDAVRRLAFAGELERALEVADAWIERDRLDPEALTAKADLLGRLGRRDDALRLLTGTVDLAPESEALHRRLAGAFDRAGQPERACAHRIALAEIDEADADAVADAMRCERSLGRAEAAERILMSVREARVRTRAERAATREADDRRFRGDFTVDADWSGGSELDVSIITPQGARLSWMGGRTTVVGEAATDPREERLGLRWTGVGTYLVEVSRVNPDDDRPIRGRLRLRAIGSRDTIPFTLDGPRATVARVRVTRTTRLEPVTGTVGPSGGGWR